jgi:uncharacterized cupin superfamily protein
MYVYCQAAHEQGLDQLPPLTESYPTMEILSGDPRQSGRVDVSDQDGALSGGVWECTRGSFRFTYTFTELATLLEGRIAVTDADGVRHELAAGDSFLVRQGETVTWEILEDMRKTYFLFAEADVPAGSVAG